LVAERRREALALVDAVERRWRFLLERIDEPLAGLVDSLAGHGLAEAQGEARVLLGDEPGATLFRLLQDRLVRVSWKLELRDGLCRILSGQTFEPTLAALEAAHARVLRSRVFVALHMHAGDGNVHTNIPVNSDDYGMLKEAEAAVVRIMALARSLDGVISGEHGIGLTKLAFLDEDELEPF